jgi:short-subunit dehydrogenase
MAHAKGVVILGSTSAMARAAALEFGRAGYDLILAARDQEENEIIAADLRVRYGVDATPLAFEATDFERHPAFFAACRERLGDALEGVLLCFGHMEDQVEAQRDFAMARRIIDANYTAAVSMLEIFARYFEERKGGFIAAVSSVAGDRGKQSNYLYGSAKAGLTTFLDGLRNRLFRSGVRVTTIKPGFVDTKMTFGMTGLMLVAPPETAGKDIFNAIRKRKDLVFTPWFWRYIMVVFRHIPEWIFKRLKQ